MAAAAEVWGDWTTVPDDEGGSYFWNLKTGETRWDAPPMQPGCGSQAAAAPSSAWERAVADDGSEYWYNGTTGETAWDPPEALSAGATAAGEEAEPPLRRRHPPRAACASVPPRRERAMVRSAHRTCLLLTVHRLESCTCHSQRGVSWRRTVR